MNHETTSWVINYLKTIKADKAAEIIEGLVGECTRYKSALEDISNGEVPADQFDYVVTLMRFAHKALQEPVVIDAQGLSPTELHDKLSKNVRRGVTDMPGSE